MMELLAENRFTITRELFYEGMLRRRLSGDPAAVQALIEREMGKTMVQF